jgi:methylated-DNA-[protein]-cysteine S-methyltransferase
MASDPTAMSEGGQVAFESSLGWVVVTLDSDHVTALDILPEPPPLTPARGPFAARVRSAVQAYFQTGLWPDDLPLAMTGTPFQQRVWECLRRIPAGATRRYGDIAREVGSSARAVGGACRANPLLLLIPCHRVVASNGHGGFAGQTVGRWPAIKAWLLAHEQRMA